MGTAVINIRTKRVEFDLVSEEPSDYLIQALKESEADIKAGRVSPGFDKPEEALAFLDKIIEEE